VTFSGGATGTVTSASTTQLTVSNLSGLLAGSLSATVTVGGVSSGTAVQVATVQPVVTPNTASLPANATTLIIHGFGFSGAEAVTFSGGVTGIVSVATANTLTVTGLFGLTPGSLTATVTSNSVTSASAVVATVTHNSIQPVVTGNTNNLAANASTLMIQGLGFDSNAANDTVTFSGGVTGTVTSATSTQLTVTNLSGLLPGSLSASVTVNGVTSGTAVPVATVQPVVTTNPANLAVNATTLTIQGAGFNSTAANDTVTFSGGVTGTVSSATATQLTVTNLSGLAAGSLSASVTVGGVTSPVVQVATVQPVVSANAAPLAANATGLVINGFGFSSTAASDTVTFSGGATGTVTSATATTLTVTNLSGLVLGSLSASVTVGGVSSGPSVPVATVTPVLTTGTAFLAANATSLVLNGFGFDSNSANDTVTLNYGGVTGTVTSATATQLTVTNLSGLLGGSLSASVTVGGVTSQAVQAATVQPLVTANTTATLLASATSLVIQGVGFDSTATNDAVTFSGGATGTVTSATATTLTVTNLSGLVGGNLSASVTVDGVGSGQAVQVAMVTPVVTANTATLAANATSLTIQGVGFDSTAANDTVTFSGGVTGTVTSATATQLTVTNLSGLVGGEFVGVGHGRRGVQRHGRASRNGATGGDR